jgi:hypothetical protein
MEEIAEGIQSEANQRRIPDIRRRGWEPSGRKWGINRAIEWDEALGSAAQGVK